LRKIAVVLTLLVVVAALTGTAAAGLSPDVVKNETMNELSPAASANWFAWTRTPADRPLRANVRAEPMPVDGVGDFRVNATGTRAWTGGIEGNRLVYQEIDKGDSDIRLYNLSSPGQAPTPRGINTDRWEWHPSISTANGDTWILFGRQNASTGLQRIFARNTTDNVLVLLQEIENPRHSLIPGQVNGNWVTWTSCRPDCHVRYDNLLNRNPATVPRPDYVRHQYASSISDDGTVYFARSGRGCGANVKLMRYRAGTDRRMVDFGDRRDLFFTYVSDLGLTDDVYYDRVRCGSGAWNIYKFSD
jgi:hypothetical protein